MKAPQSALPILAVALVLAGPARAQDDVDNSCPYEGESLAPSVLCNNPREIADDGLKRECIRESTDRHQKLQARHDCLVRRKERLQSIVADIEYNIQRDQQRIAALSAADEASRNTIANDKALLEALEDVSKNLDKSLRLELLCETVELTTAKRAMRAARSLLDSVIEELPELTVEKAGELVVEIAFPESKFIEILVKVAKAAGTVKEFVDAVQALSRAAEAAQDPCV